MKTKFAFGLHMCSNYLPVLNWVQISTQVCARANWNVCAGLHLLNPVASIGALLEFLRMRLHVQLLVAKLVINLPWICKLVGR